MMLYEKDLSWQDNAACLGMDTNMFFPDNENGFRSSDAQAVCKMCLVKEECYSWAIATEDEIAILGATTGAERKRTRKNRANAVARTALMEQMKAS